MKTKTKNLFYRSAFFQIYILNMKSSGFWVQNSQHEKHGFIADDFSIANLQESAFKEGAAGLPPLSVFYPDDAKNNMDLMPKKGIKDSCFIENNSHFLNFINI